MVNCEKKIMSYSYKNRNTKRNYRRNFIFLMVASIVQSCSFPLNAKELDSIGSVTGLPLPRYVSLKVSKANVRRGPGTTYKIDWVYNQKGFPVVITAEYGIWRRVEDFEGFGGWVHSRLLSGIRTVIFLPKTIILKSRPSLSSQGLAYINKGVVAVLKETSKDWCRVSIKGKTGWVPKQAVWGIFLEEVTKI